MIALIGWSLVHALWQGAAIAALLALILTLAARATPATRYALSLGALALAVVAPLTTATLGVGRHGDVRIGVDVPVVASDAVAPTPNPSTSPSPSPGASPSASASRVPRPSPASSADRACTFLDAAPLGRSARNDNCLAADRGARMSAGDARWAPLDRLARAWRRAPSTIEASAPWLVGAWVIGLLLFSLRLAGGIVRTRALVRVGTSVAPDGLRQLVDRLAGQLGVHAAIRVLQTTRANVPLVLGWLRPVVLVPVALASGLTAAQIELLIAHEIAHIRRHDFLVNVLQTVIETLLFFHPAVWWISARVRDEREHCCDEIAVRAGGGERAIYAEALVALETWRGDAFGLAAAATGGSLLGRVRRLVSGRPARVDLGPHWCAGVLMIAAVALTLGRSTGAAAQRPAKDMPATPSTIASSGDSTRGRPSEVIRADVATGFDARWRWAEQRASDRGFRRYWLGWIIAGDSTSRRRYRFDRVNPIHIGDVTLTGRTIFGDEHDEPIVVTGAPLEPVIGPQRPTDVVLLLEIEAPRFGSRRVAGFYLGNAAFPVQFAGLPLLWLDAAGDSESITRLGRELNAVRERELRQDLVAAIGVHQDSRRVIPALVQLAMDASEVSAVRREAAEWLGRHPDGQALAVLTRLARTDADHGVRREAIEALEHMEIPSVSDTLIDFVTTLDQHDLRKTAIEALGHRTDERVIAFLVRLASGDDDQDLSAAAVESLGNLPDDLGFDEVTRLARSSARPRIRRAAVEELGHLEPAARALDVLVDVAHRDDDASVRAAAVEAIGDVHDARAVSELKRLVGDEDGDVQGQAIEALANTVAPAEALTALEEIIGSSRRSAVTARAVEALGDFDDPRAVALLVRIAETHDDPTVQRKAASALGDVHPHDAALAALRRIAWDHPRAEVRRAAVEGFENYDKDPAALAALREIANKHPDADLRRRATSILNPD